MMVLNGPICFSYRRKSTCLPWAKPQTSTEEAQPLWLPGRGRGAGEQGLWWGESRFSPPVGVCRRSEAVGELQLRGNHKVQVAVRSSRQSPCGLVPQGSGGQNRGLGVWSSELGPGSAPHVPGAKSFLSGPCLDPFTP